MPRFNTNITHRYRHRQANQFDQACFKPKREYLNPVNGHKVILTDHGRERAGSRHGMDIDQLNTWFRSSAEGLLKAELAMDYYNQEIFVYNRHFQRGMIIAFRRDFKNPDVNDICLIVLTVYPYGKANPMQKDTEIFYVG